MLPISRISQNRDFQENMCLLLTIFSVLLAKGLASVCDETLNSPCDKMTLQCSSSKFILDIQLEALFRMVIIADYFRLESLNFGNGWNND